MNCNHSKCATPFCPFCGAPMHSGSPQALAAYLRGRQRGQDARAKKLRERLEKDNRGSIVDSHCEGSEKSAEKFGAWADWVEARLEDSDASHP